MAVYCGISQIAIRWDDECYIVPLRKQEKSVKNKYVPAALPILVEYDDYSEPNYYAIHKDANTELLEEYFGAPIKVILKIIVRTSLNEQQEGVYRFSGVEHLAPQIKADKLEELLSWDFMWVDKKVYEFMSTDHTGGYIYIPREIKEPLSEIPAQEVIFACTDMFDNITTSSPEWYEEALKYNPNLQRPKEFFSRQYLNVANAEKIANMAMELLLVNNNMMGGSYTWSPYKLYSTPQSGDYNTHKKLMVGFLNILSEYADKYNREGEED